MNIWANEHNSAYHRTRGDAPAYLPPEHRARWHRLRMARDLFEGRHCDYFLGEGRTQYDYPRVRVQDALVRLYVTFNLCRLVSLKTADLLFGAKPKLDAPSVQQTDRLDLLVRRCKFHARAHTASVQTSWAGGAFLESLVWRGEPYVINVEPDEIFPSGARNPDDQYDTYVRYATANVGTAEDPLLLLLETTCTPGLITRRLWQLDRSRAKQVELTLENWPQWPTGEVPARETRIGLDACPITYIPNECGGALERSDYDGLIELQDTVNAKFAQVARVLAKHSDPKLAAPAASADAKTGGLRSDMDVFFYRSKEEIPQYITWSAELEAAMTDRDSAVDALCIVAEMSQVLLGIKRGATPDAARKLRLEATNSLSKVGRKALNIEPAIARALEIAQRLDQTTENRRSYPVDAIGVEMRDGLPIDELDEATIISTLRSSGTMSIEDAVDRRKEDPDAAFTEVERIKAENAAATPATFGGLGITAGGNEPGEIPPAGQGVAAPAAEGRRRVTWPRSALTQNLRGRRRRPPPRKGPPCHRTRPRKRTASRSATRTWTRRAPRPGRPSRLPASTISRNCRAGSSTSTRRPASTRLTGSSSSPPPCATADS